MKLFSRALITVALAAFLTLVGCTKKETPAAGGGIVAADLMERLPASVVAFAASDTTSEGYRAFQSSQWHQPFDSYLDKLNSFASPGSPLELLGRVARTSGILKAGDGGSSPFKEAVLFAALAGDGGLELGLFAKRAAAGEPKAVLDGLESALKAEGLTPARERFGSAEGLSVPVAAAGPPRNLYVVAAGEYLGITSTTKLAERLAAPLDSIPAAERGLAVLQSQPAYQRAAARAAGISGQFASGFIDGAALVTFLKAAGQPATATVSNDTIESLPFESISFARAMNDGLNDYGWFNYKEGLPSAEVKGLLEKAGNHPGLKLVPANTLFFLSLDSAALRAARAFALAASKPEERADLERSTEALQSISGLSLAARNASGASPFPEITLVIGAADPAGFAAMAKTGLGALSAGSQLPVSGWQTKDVGGVKVDFMASPLGVGIFLAPLKDSVVISTGDAAFADIQAGKVAADIGEFFERDAMQGDKGPIGLYFLSGERLAAMIETVQGSLAMFTGGKALAEQDDLAEIRAIGAAGAALSYQDNAFRLHGTYAAEKKSR